MTGGQLAALIAAGFFAVLSCVAMVVLLRFGRLVSSVTRMVTDYRDRADLLITQAQEAVDRTNAQLARTDVITTSMDQVTANMAELSGHVSALAGFARGISSVASAPLTGLSAFVFGLRRAMLVRRALQVAVAQPAPMGEAAAVAEPAAMAEPAAVAKAPDAPARERRALTAPTGSGRAVRVR